MGAILTLAEEDFWTSELLRHATFVIDGETYQPDVWYRLDSYGKVVPYED